MADDSAKLEIVLLDDGTGPTPHDVMTRGPRSPTAPEAVPVEIVRPLPLPVTGLGGTPAPGPAGPGPAYVAGQSLAAAVAGLLDVTRALAGSLARTAANDSLGGLMTAADGVATALGRIPVVGTALEATLKTVTAGVQSFSTVVDAFVARGKQLQQYSGPLTEANVRAQMRELLADVREAQYLGPDLARLTDAQAQLRQELREILLPLKKAVIDGLANVLEGTRTFQQQAIGAVQNGVLNLGRDVQNLAGENSKVSNALNAIRLLIFGAIEHARGGPAQAPDLGRWINDLNNQSFFPTETGFDPVLGVARGRLAGPRLGVP